MEQVSDEVGLGAQVTVGVDIETEWVPLYFEARYRFLEFETQYGDIDADGFEFVVGVRLHFWALWKIFRAGGVW